MKSHQESIKKLLLSDYELGRTIGRGIYTFIAGGFGKVKVAKNKKTGKYSAIKILSKSSIIKAQQIDHVFNENRINSRICHNFIVGFQGLAQDSKYLYLVLQLINGGQLFTYLRSVENFDTKQARFYIAIVTICFEYLHQQNIIYRDLKPQNLLITNDGYLKLADFGFAKTMTQGRTFTLCGTPQYISPEVIMNQGHGKSVDWWGLGILIYELHVGIDPFNDQDPMNIYRNILRGKVFFPESYNKKAKSLTKHLLTSDLSKRYGTLKDGITKSITGVNDIKDHRWFNGICWKDLIMKKVKASYIPIVRSTGDVSNYDEYPQSNCLVDEVKCQGDPFGCW